MNTTSQKVDLLAKTLAGVLSDLIEDAVGKRAPATSSPKAERLEYLKRKEQLNAEEVEELYGWNARTLANKRVQGLGPSYVKDGKIILYPQKSLKAYQDSLRVRTADQR